MYTEYKNKILYFGSKTNITSNRSLGWKHIVYPSAHPQYSVIIVYSLNTLKTNYILYLNTNILTYYNIYIIVQITRTKVKLTLIYVY